MTRASADEDADPMESLEAAVAKELHAMLERGAFDSIGRLLSGAIESSDPAPSRALQLSFALKLLDIRSGGESEKRIRALGHLFVVADKVEGEKAPKLRFGISPRMSTMSCPARLASEPAFRRATRSRRSETPRPFGATFRTLTRD
ncbi:MAG: hypothetical protein M0D55_01135 [Elusimicrobiota bacterium]|nr:MAG: hypothetical protein M0D55_01135 [Elusimicrobiota bacterium]